MIDNNVIHYFGLLVILVVGVGGTVALLLAFIVWCIEHYARSAKIIGMFLQWAYEREKAKRRNKDDPT